MRSRLILVVAILALPMVAAAAPPAEGLARSQALVAAFLRVPAKAGPARAAAFAELDGYLALDELVTAAVAPRAAKFSAKELAQLKQSFREVLRLVAYTESGDFFRRSKLTWGKPRTAEAEVIVPVKVTVTGEDLETEIAFRWRQVGGAMKVVDVDFEGDSLLRDYQNQISRIVDKSGVAGLQKAIDERRAEVAGEKKK
jgi:ABC-type transporter MlaC component